MKILIVQDRLRSGGTERQSILLARAFAAAGHDTTLLTFRPGGALAAELLAAPTTAQATATLAQPAPRLHVLQPFDTHLDWFAPALCRTARQLAPDIILCMGRMANCRANSLALACPSASVITTMRTGKPLPRLYRRSLHESSHTVANSHEAARILATHYALPADKITVIHNSLVFAPAAATDSTAPANSTDAIAQSSHIVNRTSAIVHPPTILLCVAMLRPEKNHRELIEIAAQLPPAPAWQLWIAGDGPARAACEARAVALGIANRVRFLGFQNDPTALYRQAHLAVLTSQSESLPNFLIEAHAHGLPSIAYAVGGVTECGGIAIALADQPAFLAALTGLLSDPAARAAESARVAAHARAHFSPDAQTRRYLDLFARLRARAH